MKKQLIAAGAMVASLMLGASCGSKSQPEVTVPAELGEGGFVIEGQIPAEKFYGACIYLVPMRGPHPRQVDSAYVDQNGRFRFEGNIEQMAVLRLDNHWHERVQDLLVVTEPGVTHVSLDSVSSGYGTLQNDSLQTIKDRLDYYHQQMLQLAQARKLQQLDSAGYKDAVSALMEAQGEWNYRLFRNLGATTLSRFFFNQMFSGRLDDERKAELNELLKDTTDYTKPQPGFRRS